MNIIENKIKLESLEDYKYNCFVLTNFLAYHKIDNKLIENKMIVYPDDYLDDIDNKQTCRYYELYSFNDNNFEIIFNEDLNINNEKDLIDLIKQIKENTIEQINWDYPCFYYHLDLDQN